MKASYEKHKDHYIMKMDNLTCKIPFVYNKGEVTEIHISDELMDMLVCKYNNECLQFTYNGNPISDEIIRELAKGNIGFNDLKLSVKENMER